MLQDIYNSKEYKLAQLRTKFEGSVVLYNNKYYLLYKVNESNKCQLIDKYYNKFSGTPLIKNVEIIKKLPRVYFNRGFYLLTTDKHIISCRTGNVVYETNNRQRKDILVSF